ncbi:MAG: cytochrome b N-terminal domain-containing protein [Burkholderiales bacterium]
MKWIGERYPLDETWKAHVSEYFAPKNLNFWYFFGSLAMLVLVIQLVTGIFLTMYYKPDANLAFGSVEYIMRDVNWGWLIRYMHSTGASLFFVVVYLHMFRGLLYGSHRKPRELVWLIGMFIYLSLMAEAFFGYLLPWGQMSFWGAQVIISLFDAIPLIGPELALWIRGDYVVSDVTLNRFFAFHVILFPLILLGLVFAHIVALHKVGSNNPDGIEIKNNKDERGIPVDGIPFHPYYTIKDSVGAIVFLIIFSIIVFFTPEMGGWFLEPDNFIPADPLKTPEHIVPLWYFTPYYAILRATTDELKWVIGIGVVLYMVWALLKGGDIFKRGVLLAIGVVLLIGLYALTAKVWGVLLMGAAVLILCFLPWLDKSPVKSIRYRGRMFKTALALFAASFIGLGYLGTLQPTTLSTHIAQALAVIYFGFFLLMPWYSRRDETRPVPERVTT